METIWKRGMIAVVVGVVLQPGLARAESRSVEAPGGDGDATAARYGNVDESVAPSPVAQQELERLRQLKQQDPEAFRKAVQEKKAAFRERMSHLKETDPDAFRRIKHHMQEKQRQRLAHLKEKYPEKYEEVMQRRKAGLEHRLEELKTKNPERYAQVMQRRQEAQERWKNATPEQKQKWLERHPGGDRDNNPQGPNHSHDDRGVRDHGQGEGRDGVGMGGERRAPGAGPKGRR